jgi:hypothetical protein
MKREAKSRDLQERPQLDIRINQALDLVGQEQRGQT